MYTYSINPASIIDEAIDLSTRLSGTAFPISIFPAKIQRIIREVHECHNYPHGNSSRHRQHAPCPNQARLDGKPHPVYGIDWKTGSEQKPSAQFCNETIS